MKEIVGNKRVTNSSLPNFITVKIREIFDKKEIAETFNSSQLSWLHSRQQNVNPKLYSLQRSFPQYHQSYRLGTGKCICESQNKQKSSA